MGRKNFFDVVTLNSSGAPQFHAAFSHWEITPRRVTGERNRVVAVACQEHKARQDKWVDLGHQARRDAWAVFGAQATTAEAGGASAGTLVAAPRHIGAAPPFGGAQQDCSPPESPGRLSAAWVDTSMLGGLLVISVYFWTGEGWTRRNLRLLETAGALARRHGAAWVICADFNSEPEQLRPFSDWLEKMRAVVAAPTEPTNHPSDGGTPRVLDYFLVDARIACAVRGVEVMHDVPASPHRAVKITFEARATNYLVKVPARPAALPKVPPVGCGRKPEIVAMPTACGGPSSSTTSTSTSASTPASTSATGSPPEIADRAWASLITVVEQELCGRCDLVDSRGKALPRYTGRAAPLRFVQKQVLPPRSSGLGSVPKKIVAMSWAATRIAELANLSRRLVRLPPTPAQCLQWTSIHSRFVTRTGHLATLITLDSDTWTPRLDMVAQHTMSGADWEILECLAHEIAEEAKTEKAALAHSAAKAWRAWVAQEMKKGAGALHAYVKRETIPPMRMFLGRGAPTASPQQMVDNEREDWNKVWRAFADSSDAPWRHDGFADEYSMPRIHGQEILAAAKELKIWTGVGTDWVPPRAYGWLADTTPQVIADFLMLLEALACWPGAVAQILIHLIAKKGGGTRPIGVRPSIVRIWERLRRPVCWEWRQKNTRLYNYAAVGRTAEAAVWRQALYDEAADALDSKSASTLLDLVKAFEYVRLRLVWERMKATGFPAVMARMILEAFSFARCVTMLGAYADVVYTCSAILAGGCYATDALFVVLMDVCDTLLLCNPGASLCLYVDDLSLHAVAPESTLAAVIVNVTREAVTLLEQGLGLRVSRGPGRTREGKLRTGGKTKATASSIRMLKRIAPGMALMGIETVHTVGHLGVDYAPARPPQRHKQRNRWHVLAKRKGRYKTLGLKAGLHVFKTGGVPSLTHGVTVYAVRSTQTKEAQRHVAETSG